MDTLNLRNRQSRSVCSRFGFRVYYIWILVQLSPPYLMGCCYCHFFFACPMCVFLTRHWIDFIMLFFHNKTQNVIVKHNMHCEYFAVIVLSVIMAILDVLVMIVLWIRHEVICIWIGLVLFIYSVIFGVQSSSEWLLKGRAVNMINTFARI